jgi:hypothetical protein
MLKTVFGLRRLPCAASIGSALRLSSRGLSTATGTAQRTPLPFAPLNRAFPVTPPALSARPKVESHSVYDSFAAAVGNTSLIRLNGPSALTGCNIYGKAEYENPGGSVKDRAALYLIKDAEEKGKLVPGQPGLIIEGTAGNTGIGLTMAGNARGYRTIM